MLKTESYALIMPFLKPQFIHGQGRSEVRPRSCWMGGPVAFALGAFC